MNAITTLERTNPRKIRFWKSRDARTENSRLEGILGLPAGTGPASNDLLVLNRRYHELKALVDGKTPTAPAAFPAVSEVVSLKGLHGQQLQDAIAKQLARSTALHSQIEANAPAIVAVVAKKFVNMCAADRQQFSADGNALALDDFNALSLEARVKHLTAGGKLTAPEGTQSERVRSANPVKRNGSILALNVFNKMGRPSQLAYVRLGGLVGK